jgi:hypothetical protein
VTDWVGRDQVSSDAHSPGFASLAVSEGIDDPGPWRAAEQQASVLGAASSDAITENAWWFDWNLELQRFTNRVSIYLALMDDRYPSTDQQQSVHLDYVYPDAAR